MYKVIRNRSNFPQPFIFCRYVALLLTFIRRGQFVLGKQNGAIHIFNVYKTDFSRSVLRFGVNCAFIFVTDYAIATGGYAVSLGNFALC